MMATPVRNSNLDLIKLTCCIAVVLLHCVKAESFGLCMITYQLCIFAVPCFFMASGYLLLHKRTVDWKYSAGKAAGILRLALVWNGILLLLHLLHLVVRGSTAITQIIALFPDYLKGTVRGFFQHGTLWQLWYLGTMGILYLALPVLHRVLGRVTDDPRRAFRLWCVLAAISVLVQAAGVITGQPLQKNLCQTFRLWTSGQYFLLGGLMPGLIRHLQQRLTLRKHSILTAAATAAALIWRMVLELSRLHWVAGEYYYDDPLSILWIALLFSLLMRLELPPIAVMVVSFMTPLFMGVYMIHVPIRNALRQLPFVADTHQLLLALLVAAASFLFAYLIKKLPISKYLLEI